MKFMVTWRVHPEKRHETLKGFSRMTTADDAADRGPKIKLIGRWHDLQRFTGVAICETDDAQAVAAWAMNWNGVLDLEVVPVLDDDEARAVAKKKFG